MKISILLVLTILLVYVDMTYSKPGTPDDDDDKPAVSYVPTNLQPVRPAYKPKSPKSEYTISLRGGNKPSYRRFSSRWFQWRKPLSPGIGGPCSRQGVIRTTQPPWAKSLLIYMKFSNPYKYSFHIGDSPVNRGWGYFRKHWWNSEMFSYHKRYVLYANHGYSPASGRKRADIANAIQSQVWLVIRKHEVRIWRSLFNWKVYKITNKMFAFTPYNFIRIGLNRIIEKETGAPIWGRVGRGLCYIRLTWTSF